jgi:NADH-quinone oxidoreductase subunit E
MVQVGQHPNIELMTYSEVEEVKGYIGNFNAKIRRKARFIDEDKCTGCGQCIERCPVHFEPTEMKLAPEVKLEPEKQAVIDKAISKHIHERGPLVTVLQVVNADLGYIPPESLRYIASKLNVPLADVYHVATFYTAFSLTPRGEHNIKVCMGTACHVRGSARVLDALEERLEIKAGDTTKDQKFTLETVNCLGACAMGPVILVNGEYKTVSPADVNGLIDSLLEQPVGA